MAGYCVFANVCRLGVIPSHTETKLGKVKPAEQSPLDLIKQVKSAC